MIRHPLIALLGLTALAALGTGCFHHAARRDAFEREIAERCVNAAAASRPAVYVVSAGGAVTAVPPAPVAPAPVPPPAPQR